MTIATQEQIDKFMSWAHAEPTIYPYLSTTKYNARIEAAKDDWEKIIAISASGSTMVKISMNRPSDIDFTISLWSANPSEAASAIRFVKSMIGRYKPRGINSCVHSSNVRSLAMHKKIFGDPWGIEKAAAWNALTGTYDDLHWFRKLL